MDGLRIDLLARRIERAFDDGVAHDAMPSSGAERRFLAIRRRSVPRSLHLQRPVRSAVPIQINTERLCTNILGNS